MTRMKIPAWLPLVAALLLVHLLFGCAHGTEFDDVGGIETGKEVRAPGDVANFCVDFPEDSRCSN